MKRNAKFLIVFCCLLAYCYLDCYAKGITKSSDRIVPKWIKNTPVTTFNKLKFVTITVYSPDLTVNYGTILDQLSTNMPREWHVSSRIKTDDYGHTEYSLQGLESAKHSQSFKLQAICDGEPVDISCEFVDSFWEQERTNNNTQYKHILLYQVADSDYKGQFCKWTKETQYGIKHIWPSFLLPGSGQMIKGDFCKGGLIMGGSVALAAGATLCSLTRQDYLAKMANTHSAATKQQYVTKSNNLNTGMWTCVGCLAALYVYNIVDAFVAPGARRIIVTPAVSTEGQYGASVTYNF